MIGTEARENVEPRFKPIVPALGNFDRFVQLMFVRKDASACCLNRLLKNNSQAG
jgi:hypothetical protein